MHRDTKTLHALVAEHAAAHPRDVAVECGSRRMTYGELTARTERLAGRLAEAGSGPEHLVGLAVSRSFELIVGLLAISRSGGAWLPLDPSYPRERLDYLVADSGIDLLVADAAGHERLGRHGIRRLDPGADLPGTPPPPVVSADQLAYVIYTSGSTGRPKGVQLTHGGLANLVRAQAEIFGRDSGRRVYQFAPASFDASVFEIVMALAFGATLVLPEHGSTPVGAELAEALVASRATHLTLTPSALATIDTPPSYPLTLVCAGESLPGALARRWAPGRRLLNAYGPTEATVWATVAEVAADGGKPLIGTAIAGARPVVVNAALAEVPAGERGELVIGGAGVARGYHGRPRLTAERFVPDPASDQPGARRYRTGDLVRSRANGGLEFLGRLDDQVKIRGIRVEPDEVAAQLREHPEVSDAAVVARRHGTENRLIAYVTGAATPARLREFLAARLPAALVPAAIVALAAFPLTPSGKLDRAALPAPERTGTIGRAPVTTAEHALCEIVSGLLGLDRVGVDEDFFALGGHSLLAARLAARVREQLAAELPLAVIHSTPTVAGMARHLVHAEAPRIPPLTRAARGGPLPLSFPQERVWFLEQLAPGNLAYNAQATLRLHGPLRPEVLRATLREIVRRHEIFRTAFRWSDGMPTQQPLEAADVDIPLIDLSDQPSEAAMERTEQIVAQLISRPFDTARPPLVRWALVRLSSAEHLLVHVEHHLIHDGWSFAVLLREMQSIYTAFANGSPVPLPEPTVQYADFAVWQRHWLRGAELDRQLDWWRATLAGAPPVLDLPTDRPRPPMQDFAGAALRFELDPALCARLRAFGRARGVTLFTTMLAGFATLLHRYSGQDDLLIGTGAADRRLAELEQVIGMVVNTLALRIDISARPSFAELLQRVSETVVAAHEWQDTPFDRVVEAVAPVRDPSRNPLVQALFSFHDSAVPELDFDGVRGTVLERHNGSAKADLNIVVVPRAEQRIESGRRDDSEPITLIWEYATALFDAATMRRMAEHYRRLLRAALDAPDTPVDTLTMLPDNEIRRLTRDWNDTAAVFPAGTIQQRFEQWARVRPEHIAVVGTDDIELTYAALNERANRLAHLLRARGVRADQPVGVLLPRGADLIVALLAVLKAGGAYVPLDPQYPRQRLAHMLADSGAHTVVSATGLPAAAAPEATVLIDREPLHRMSVTDPDSGAGPRGLAHIVFTSGSTGRPKGVMVEHRSVLRLVSGQRYVEFGPDRRLPQLGDASFDAATFEIWGALLHGATVCVMPADAALTPGRLGPWLRDHRITDMFLTTALCNAVLETHPDSFESVDTLLAGGEALDPETMRRLLDGRPPRRLVNVYGPTETTTFATWQPINAVDPAHSIPIGRPITNTTAYVLDEHLRPAPIGVPGELCLGGPGVARGYAGRPGRTAAAFVPDPVGRTGERLYRTGDIVRWLSSGELEYLGRRDDQVKIRGYRIELGEIQAALTEHAAIARAVVVVRGTGGERHLAAYVVTEPGLPRPQVADLRDFLRARLPIQLRPSVFHYLDELPLTAHGKVDRAALPERTGHRDDGETSYTAARTPTEQRLSALCAQLLGVDRVGVHDDFFGRGGHSLLAMRLVGTACREFDVEVPLSRFLAAPTVADLAAALADPALATADRIRAVPGTDRLLAELDELTDRRIEELLHEFADNEDL